MTKLNLSKAVINNASAEVLAEIESNYLTAKQVFDSIEKPTKSEKDVMLKAKTKLNYFGALHSALNENSRALGALYFIMHNAKVTDPKAYLKETAENSYSLDKLAYLLKCLAIKNFSYSASNTTGANIIIMIELLKNNVAEFKPKDAKRIQDKLKAEVEKKADLGYTQVNQTIKLAERIGLVSHKSGKRSLEFDATYKVLENDLTRYLKNQLTA